MKTNKLTGFVDKKMLLNFAGCILIITTCVESAKLMFPLIHTQYLVFAFSAFVALVRFLVNDKFTFEEFFYVPFNTATLFLSSIGLYESAIKNVVNLIR